MLRILTGLITILLATSLAYAQPEEKMYMVGDFAPDFTAKTIDGKNFRLSDQRGKYVLLNFWGTWCQPCLHEIPNLKDVQLFYSGDSFEIVSVSVEHAQKDVRRFVDSVGMDWIQISELASDDPQKSISGLYELGIYPSNFLINKEGKIIQYPFGYLKTADGKMKELTFAGYNLVPRLEQVLGIEKNMSRYLTADSGSIFSFTAPKARVVYLAGSFSAWGPLPMYKYQDKWVCRVSLKPGEYLYKFIVDGQWMLDPANTNIVDDGKGNKNSSLLVK